MSLRLRDLWAPAWSVTLAGQRYEMRPLSLGTFADLEGEGISLPSLSGKAPANVWARLFILLAQLEPPAGESYPAFEERILAQLLGDPIAMKKIQTELSESLSFQSKTAKYVRRQVKNPLELKKDKTKKPVRDEEDEPEELDATFLLSTARLSGLSLADLSRMSFRGLLAMQEWLKENPPQPTGLFG